MELIHADVDRSEIRYIFDFDKMDSTVSQEPKAKLEDNSFAVTVSDAVWSLSPIIIGHYLYIPSTEWGGQVEYIRHNTASRQVTVSGLTWRGALYRKIIEPTSGNNYKTVSNLEANAAINGIIGSQLGPAFGVSNKNSGIIIKSKAFRYENMLLGIEEMLTQYGAALAISYDQVSQKAILSARKVVDHSDQVDLSQDYGSDMITTAGGMDRYNHVIALGAGELEDRDILHVYRLDDGTLTMLTPAWAGTAKDHVRTYNYNNPEDIDKLREGAEKILIDCAPYNSLEIDPRVEGIDLPIGDIVGARDKLTGMVSTATVVGKTLIMDGRGTKTEIKVG